MAYPQLVTCLRTLPLPLNSKSNSNSIDNCSKAGYTRLGTGTPLQEITLVGRSPAAAATPPHAASKSPHPPASPRTHRLAAISRLRLGGEPEAGRGAGRQSQDEQKPWQQQQQQQGQGGSPQPLPENSDTEEESPSHPPSPPQFSPEQHLCTSRSLAALVWRLHGRQLQRGVALIYTYQLATLCQPMLLKALINMLVRSEAEDAPLPAAAWVIPFLLFLVPLLGSVAKAHCQLTMIDVQIKLRCVWV